MNIIRADLFKMLHSSVVKVLIGISIVCSIVMLTITNGIGNGNLSENLSGIGFLVSDASMLSILGAVIAGTFICGDFDQKIIHQMVASGGDRTFLMVGKTLGFLLVSFSVMLPYGIVTIAGLLSGQTYKIGSMGVGFLNLLTQKNQTDLTLENLLKLIVIVIVLMMVYGAQLSVCALLSIWIKKPIVVIGVYYVLSLLCAQIINLSKNSEILDHIFSLTPFGGNHMFLTLSSSMWDILYAVVVSIAFTGMILFCMGMIFRRREIV